MSAARTRYDLHRRAVIATLTALIIATAGAVMSPAVADEPPGWHDGTNTYSDVVNCPSQIGGYPYWERGMAAKVGYFADPDSGLPRVGTQFTHLHLVFAGLGNPCVGGTYFWPSVALPAGVEWYKSADIKCYWNGSPLTGENCPQWNAVLEGQGPSGSDSYVHPGNTTWHVSRGGIVELVLPIWAPEHEVTGGTVQAWIQTADGNLDPTLTPASTLWFFSPPPSQPTPTQPTPSQPTPSSPTPTQPSSPTPTPTPTPAPTPAPGEPTPTPSATCQGRAVTVDLRAGQAPTSLDDVILGTPRGDSIRGGKGNDVICAGGGDDIVRGGNGNDRLAGDGGRDRLVGGPGQDGCTGGPGFDTYRSCEPRLERNVA